LNFLRGALAPLLPLLLLLAGVAAVLLLLLLLRGLWSCAMSGMLCMKPGQVKQGRGSCGSPFGSTNKEPTANQQQNSRQAAVLRLHAMLAAEEAADIS
jgi:hypothetical protein